MFRHYNRVVASQPTKIPLRFDQGPNPIGAFSSCGVWSTFRKHQITPPQTTIRAKIIVIHPAVVMKRSSVGWLCVVQVDPLALPPRFAGADGQREQDKGSDDRDDRHA